MPLLIVEEYPLLEEKTRELILSLPGLSPKQIVPMFLKMATSPCGLDSSEYPSYPEDKVKLSPGGPEISAELYIKGSLYNIKHSIPIPNVR